MRRGASAIVYNPELDRFLLVKRAETKREHPNKWEFPGGHVDEGETPRQAALREMKEETGLDGQIIRTGEPGQVTHQSGELEICPFLVTVDTDTVELSREHEEFEWVALEKIEEFDTVEGIQNELKAVDLIKTPHRAAVAVTRNTETGKYLLMKRAPEKKNYPEKWEFPAGNIEDGENPRETALRELEEETGLTGEIVRDAESFTVDNEGEKIEVHPVLVEVDSDKVEMTWEHTEYRWVTLDELEDFDTVDGIKNDIELLDIG